MALQQQQQRQLNVPLPPTLCLEVLEGPCSSQSYQSTGSFLTVGRTKRSAVFLKNDGVSEKHAELAWNGTGAWTLKDVGSTNGTKLNDHHLQEYEPYDLHEGDVIRFGVDVKVRVQLKESTCANTTVDQLLRALYEAACQRVEAEGRMQARMLLEKWKAAAAVLAAPQDVQQH